MTAATVRADSLRAGWRLRDPFVDYDHVTALAAVFDALPPILVHRDSRRIIDGHHRWQAAQRLGRDLPVEWLDVALADARDQAVRRNVRHGRPLTVHERKVEARRLVEAHADWSDARLAEWCGLDDKTVAALRPCPPSESPSLDTRAGRDGKAYPASPAAQRERVADAVRARPEASAREVARETGVSPTTAAHVKRALTAVPPLPDTSPPRVDEVVRLIPDWRSGAEFRAGQAVQGFGTWMRRWTRPHDYTEFLGDTDLSLCPPQLAESAAAELRRVAGYLTRAASEVARPALREVQP